MISISSISARTDSSSLFRASLCWFRKVSCSRELRCDAPSSVGGGRYPALRVGTGRRPPGSLPRRPCRSEGSLASLCEGVEVREEEEPIASS